MSCDLFANDRLILDVHSTLGDNVMLLRIIFFFTSKLPSFRRWWWQKWYQQLAGYQVNDWNFMNYGFQSLDNNAKQLALDPDEEIDRYCIQLYNRVASAVDLTGLDVVEVGCGRGGGASFVKRYLNPSTMIGVDFSEKAIKSCAEKQQVDGLSFCVGDAESLPFDDQSFDAVINVESSHCYGSIPNFLGQVHRVLRPGGYFLYADGLLNESVEQLYRQFEESGMTIVEDEDITSNVLKALALDSKRKEELIRGNIRFYHRWLSGTFEQFAGLEDTSFFNSFQDGTFVYKRFLLQK